MFSQSKGRLVRMQNSSQSAIFVASVSFFRQRETCFVFLFFSLKDPNVEFNHRFDLFFIWFCLCLFVWNGMFLINFYVLSFGMGTSRTRSSCCSHQFDLWNTRISPMALTQRPLLAHKQNYKTLVSLPNQNLWPCSNSGFASFKVCILHYWRAFW